MGDGRLFACRLKTMTENRTTTGQRIFLLIGVCVMALVVTASNILVEIPVANIMVQMPAMNRPVEIPLSEWMTWGALSYPFSFLVTDLTNRALGPSKARVVVMVGFVAAVGMSLVFADTRIALASGTAFLLAQLMDVFLFDKLRKTSWWKAPVFSSFVASSLDTVIFFSLAFVGTGLPWMGWAIGDYWIKLAMIAVLIIPFRGLLKFTDPLTLASTTR